MNKRILSFVLVLALCIGLLSGISFNASAATVNYVTGNPSSKYQNVIKNWGTRGTTATFLSPNAEKFYKNNNITYEDLAKLSGSSNTASVPSSALYKALNELVTENQKRETSYADTRPLFAYTDCQDNGSGANFRISSFYSGILIGPEWDGGETWNREHTWPNSKGDANGNGENDIMMLRPTEKSENGSRSNTAYGESATFYDPNKVSGGKYNLHGDVARIMLYVYTRWGTQNMWGSSGVIESKDILLKWMAEDPVDTWEMGRNDSVESITGTRNIYVDYPELAFLLFNEEVPENMISPANGDGTIPPTPTTPPAPSDPREILEEAYALEPGEYLPYEATLTGSITKISEAYSTQYQNVTVVMVVEDCEDLPIKCFRLKGNGADKIGIGDIITVTGNIINYQHTSGDTEVEFAQGCTLDSWVDAGTDVPTPPSDEPSIVKNPVADTAYKLGMHQVSLSSTLYFNGKTESASVSYRLATCTDTADAADVYLEAVSGVTGGYRLYFYNNGTKTYIRVYEREDGTAGKGKGSLAFVTQAPSEYFTYDTTANTLVYRADADNAYYLGTYSTFKTFSVSNTSYITGSNAGNVDKSQFPARFYMSSTQPSDENPGDITGDTALNNDDVVLLMWHVLFPEQYPVNANCDINSDNTINNDDVVYLMWHVLFPEQYPL